MAVVVPTVLATSPDEYAAMLARAESLNKRVHIDICDGQFAPNKTISLAQVQVSDGTEVDLHLMIKDVGTDLETALSLHPRLIIFHAESEGDVMEMAGHARSLGVKAGLAVLPQTTIVSVRALVEKVDHVLIFTGTLGQNGGEFQADQLVKVGEARHINPGLEISVDGGVSDANAALLAIQGVDVLYAGGFLQHAADPQAAYDSIMKQAGETT